MLPMLGGEVIESQQRIAILGQTFGVIIVLPYFPSIGSTYRYVGHHCVYWTTMTYKRSPPNRRR